MEYFQEATQQKRTEREVNMNNKAQIFTPITMIFMLLVALIVWALFSAKFLNDSIGQALNTGYFSGVEAFLLSNLNLIILIALIIAIISLGAYSIYANQQ